MNRVELQEFIKQRTDEILKAEGARAELERRQNELNDSIIVSNDNVNRVLPACTAIVSAVSEKARSVILPIIENLLSKMLCDIFQRKYAFKLDLSTRGSKPYIQPQILELINEEWVTTSPEYHGGGLGNVLNAGIKIILRILLRDKIKGPLIFDETFANLDKEVSRNVFAFLSDISKNFDIQIILVTHDPATADPDVIEGVDRLIKIERLDGVSKMEVLK